MIVLSEGLLDQASKDFIQARDVARRFLSRWSDGFTRSVKDDLVQEAACEAWRCRQHLRDPDRFSAFVRTISRRLRYRALRGDSRRTFCSLQDDLSVVEERACENSQPEQLLVDGNLCEISWLLKQLDAAFEILSPLNGQLTKGYYEGFSCAELATRYGLEEESVKVRLYRCRRKIRKEIEGRARRAALSL